MNKGMVLFLQHLEKYIVEDRILGHYYLEHSKRVNLLQYNNLLD